MSKHNSYQTLDNTDEIVERKICDIKSSTGKALVTLDTIPNALLALTLISKTLKVLGWYRLIPVTGYSIVSQN